MRKIKYEKLNKLDPEALRELMNKQKTREYLIQYELFDSNSIKSWIQEKCEINNTDGCRIRGIINNGSIAGWCGIQFENGIYEIAIVLDDKFWGMGKKVFNDILSWAKELGHNEIYIHFLDTRPEYKFLRKISKNVFKTEMLGNKFTTYQISIS